MVDTTPVVSDANNLKLEKNMKEKTVKNLNIKYPLTYHCNVIT